MTDQMTAPQPAQADNVDDGVIRLGGGERKPVAMRPLFSIEGKTYKIPTTIRPNLALSILAKFEQDGPMAAQIYMLRTILGEQAFNALINYDGLDEDELKAITDKVMEVTFSSVEKESGN